MNIKLLMTMKLSDRSLKNHISPIAHLNEMDEIILVRNFPGPTMDKVRYECPSQHRVAASLFTIPFKLSQMIRLSSIEKPILIHSYLLFPHGYLAYVAGKMTGRKVGVSLIAGPVELFALGGSPIKSYAYCRPLPKLSFFNKIALSILKSFDVITVTGTYTQNYLIGQGIEKKKIFILPHDVDKRFQPSGINKDYDLIYVGRLAPVKHVETIIKAVSVVKKSIPSIKVAIVGDGTERGMLENLAVSIGVNNQINFVGYQMNTWEWYNRSKISILTSEREGFPYTIIESIKCGVPTIVSDCGDVKDVVIDSFNGRIVSDYEDYVSFADAIVDLLSHPDLINEYSINCLQTSANISPDSVESAWKTIMVMLSEK